MQQTNLTHTQGDTLTRKITVVYGDNIPINITGYEFIFTLKSKIDSVTNDVGCILQKKWTTPSDPTNGITTLLCSNLEMTLPAQAYFYDIQWYNPATGEVKTFIAGKFIITSQITNSIT